MESSSTAGETVLPRPVEELPMSALAPATRKLADKLIEHFTLGEPAALALAQAVVDPSGARRAVEFLERLRVPDGVILAIRSEVWARNIIPDPRNPRIGPSRRHLASNLIGTGESTRFRPLAESTAAPGRRPELVQRLANQEHLAWAAQPANGFSAPCLWGARTPAHALSWSFSPLGVVLGRRPHGTRGAVRRGCR
jgi:hypothetical protein